MLLSVVESLNLEYAALTQTKFQVDLHYVHLDEFCYFRVRRQCRINPVEALGNQSLVYLYISPTYVDGGKVKLRNIQLSEIELLFRSG